MRLLLLALLAVAPLVARAAGAPGAKEDPAAPWRYALVWSKPEDLAVEVFVNEALAHREPGDGSTSGQSPADAWVMPGANTLRVRVTVDSVKKRKDFGVVSVRLVGAATPQELPDAAALAEFRWAPDGKRPPFEQSVPVVVTHPTGSTLWSDAEPLKLDAATRKQALAFAAEVHAAYAKKDPQRLAYLSQWKINDSMRMRGSPEMTLEAMAGRLSGVLQKAQAGALAARELSVQAAAGGRLLRISRGGAPFLSWRHEGARSTVDLYVANIGGRWMIAR